jgi:hypothetical protein
MLSSSCLLSHRFAKPHHLQQVFFGKMRCLSRRFFASYKPVPRLPLPELPQTVRGYLEAVEPLVSPAEFAATKRRAEALLEPGSEGQRLHEDLKRLEAESPTSWIEGKR